MASDVKKVDATPSICDQTLKILPDRPSHFGVVNRPYPRQCSDSLHDIGRLDRTAGDLDEGAIRLSEKTVDGQSRDDRRLALSVEHFGVNREVTAKVGRAARFGLRPSEPVQHGF